MKYQNQCYMTKSNLETDIFNYKTPEFFINMKDIPDKKSEERKAFVLEEKNKCREGININGVYIPGSLYFHLNYYHLQGDDLKTGRKSVFLPRLRDNEWVFFNDYEEAYKNKLIYTFFGLRQAGKSEMIVSLCLRELSLFKDTEALALFSRQPDKDTFVKKISTAITYGEKFIIVPNIDKDWSKDEIRFGFTKIDNTTDLRARLYIYNTQEGKKIQISSGKALKHGSKVYYEDKVGNIEDCKVGDKIFGRDGKLTTVLGVYPQGIVDLYRITLSDGRTIECSGDHLWTIENVEMHRDRKETIETKKIYETYKRKYFNSKLNKNVEVNRYKIPNIDCIKYAEKEVDIDPYYLGLWLGDGTTNLPGVITSKDEEIVKYVEKYAEKLGAKIAVKGYLTYKIVNKEKNKHTPIHKIFKKYKLPKNKHIPEQFLFNSKKIRLALIQGLMDTDGYIDKNGKISLSLSNKILANDAAFLLRSLGINCTITTKKTSYFNKKYNKRVECKTAYMLYIGSCDTPLFRLNRKLTRQKKSFKNQATITNVQKIDPDYATCICVDNSDSLFLTDNFIPTHNSPSFLLMDEIAINPFRGVYDTIEPGLLSDFGTLRCSPVFTFTGGEADKAKDAENLVKHPTDKQFTTVQDDNSKIGGRFMSGLYRKDCKYETTISEHINTKTNTWLDNYPIYVSDFDKSLSKINKEKEEALKSPDSNTFLLKRIFFPLNLDDVFLTEENNKFNKEAISQQQTFLKEKYEPVVVDLFRDLQGNIQWKSSNRKLINKFPVTPTDNKDAGCLMIEPPIRDVPRFTYVVGIDPIHHNDSEAREVSLASITVYKRMLSPFDEFKNQIVFTYRGRPSSIEEFHELALMIAEFYNAVGTVIPEASEQSIFQYFRLKKKGHYLADTFDLIKDVNKGYNRNASKGLPPTTVNQRHYMNLMVEEVNETIIDLDQNGDETVIQGASKIFDYMLLEELKNYKSYKNGRGVHNGNYDSIVSFGVALSLAKHLDIVSPLLYNKKNFYNDDNIHYVKDYTKTIFGTIKKGNRNVSDNASQNSVKFPSWIKR